MTCSRCGYNNSLRKNTISGAVIIPGKQICNRHDRRGGRVHFQPRWHPSAADIDETTGIQESTVTAMYCDYASNSQLWFCTTGYINRAYVSLPVSEFGIGTGIRTTIAEITGV